jgi:hypothetical protein
MLLRKETEKEVLKSVRAAQARHREAGDRFRALLVEHSTEATGLDERFLVASAEYRAALAHLNKTMRLCCQSLRSEGSAVGNVHPMDQTISKKRRMAQSVAP